MLKINNMTVAYGSAIAVRDVSLQVSAGAVICLLGPNGAGKSTVFKAISGLIRPQRGGIFIDGIDITGRDPEDIVRLGVHQVPEGRSIFPDLTVQENLELGALRLSRSATQAGVAQTFRLYPLLERKRRHRAASLSGGEQQILAIARALIGKPRLLMLDEPSLGIAPLVVREIFNTLNEVRREGTTILLAEQDAKTALGISDYGYMLQVGGIALEGKSEDLLRDDVMQESYFGEL